jgi:hypothetical protein
MDRSKEGEGASSRSVVSAASTFDAAIPAARMRPTETLEITTSTESVKQTYK